MPAGDDRHSGVSAARNFDLDIEFLGNALFQGDVDPPLLDKALTPLDGLRIRILQHFELILRSSDQSAQSDRDRQSDHARSGNSHSHRIFQYVGTQPGRNLFRFRPQYLAGLGHAQRNGNGFRAADRRNDLSFYQSNYLLPFGF